MWSGGRRLAIPLSQSAAILGGGCQRHDHVEVAIEPPTILAPGALGQMVPPPRQHKGPQQQHRGRRGDGRPPPALWVSDLYSAQQRHAPAWQICLAHYADVGIRRTGCETRSPTSRKPKSAWVAAVLRQAFVQPDRTQATQVLRHVADQLRDRFPKLAAFIETSEADVLSYMDLPAQHRTKIHSTNQLNRTPQQGSQTPR
jgi:hypothetical protein